MCVKRRFLSGFLLLVSSLAIWPQAVLVPVSTLEEILREVVLIRQESDALEQLLATLGSESTELRRRLLEVETALTIAEILLQEASLSLEKSEAALIPLREDLRKLREELGALQRQAFALNEQLKRSERGKKFWMIAAISIGLVFGVVEIGRVLRK